MQLPETSDLMLGKRTTRSSSKAEEVKQETEVKTEVKKESQTKQGRLRGIKRQKLKKMPKKGRKESGNKEKKGGGGEVAKGSAGEVAKGSAEKVAKVSETVPGNLEAISMQAKREREEMEERWVKKFEGQEMMYVWWLGYSTCSSVVACIACCLEYLFSWLWV